VAINREITKIRLAVSEVVLIVETGKEKKNNNKIREIKYIISWVTNCSIILARNFIVNL